MKNLTLYELIQQEALNRGLSVKEFSKECGVSFNTIYKLGKDDAIHPKNKTYYKIATYIGMKPSDLAQYPIHHK